MNSYYLTLVLKPGMEEKERKTLLDAMVKKLVGDEGKVEKTTSAEVATKTEKASVVKEDLWGEKDLSYPIKKATKGFYAHFEISADPKNAKGLDKILELEEDILRYLFVRA